MRRSWLLIALLLAGCVAAPPSDEPLPESALREARGGVVFDDWPAVARRPWPQSGARGMPAGFVDSVLIEGLDEPTAMRFLPDGSVLVTEQAGVVRIFPAVDRDQSRVLLDLRDGVFRDYQLGLLGMAIDPRFAAEPYLYLAYTRDAVLGGEAPTYGSADGLDSCPERSTCPASARVVRFRLEGTPLTGVGPEQVLLEDWCISGPNHSIGTLAFGPDGALYAGGGDGADGLDLDYGQISQPPNACADPPTAVGEEPSPATAQGGSLRAQDLALGDDPVSLDGTIVRVDPATGQALSDNPLAASGDANARRIIAYGLRNPFRFAFRPGSSELWIADVGWATFEEVNRLVDPTAGTPANFGWPCYEGPERQAAWQALDSEACAQLYAAESELTFPAMSFARGTAGDLPCDAGSNAISAMTFYDGTAFPERFHGALFFADISQRCLYVVEAGADGLPDPRTLRLFSHPVRASDLVVGPDGALYYTNVVKGEIRRISWR